MKNAVVTIAMGENFQSIARMTHPSLRKYAERIRADFVVIDQQKVSQTSPHFEKFQIYDLLNRYERIIYIDTDVIVRDDCPNLFDVVKPEEMGAFDEGAIMDRTKAMAEIAQAYEESLKEWKGKYYNTGVMVISRVHKELFRKPEKEIWNFYEQSYLNLKILRLQIRMHDLHYRFNRMNCMDQKTGEHRLKSYIVHYAGVLGGLTALIPFDLQRWESGEYKSFRRNIVIGAGNNRLGDNVCAEPVIRYIIENTPDTDFIIVSIFPQLFKRYEDRARIVSFDNLKTEYNRDKAYLHINAAVQEENPIKRFLTCDSMHMVDFLSIVCLKRQLPDHLKTIRLDVTPKGLSDVLEIAGCPIQDHVLIHPGRSWPSKTFPATYWNEIIAGVAKKHKVAIIGADTLFNGFGTVEGLALPDGVVDFRNLLDEEGLIAAVSMAPVLVTNDSAPLHVAGAFDNHIVLLPTCKHPDLVLPHRNGSKYYKVQALYKKILSDEGRFNPVEALQGPEMEKLPGDVMEYIPDAKDVVEAVDRAISGSPKIPTAQVS
jgi:ADP-heptose:LPS heptosyltransferase